MTLVAGLFIWLSGLILGWTFRSIAYDLVRRPRE